MPGTGRRFIVDLKDADHLARDPVPRGMMAAQAPVVRPREKSWRLTERLNQGNSPKCVGFAFTHLMLAQPKRQTGLDPAVIYREAQKVDEWPGEAYEGTSVRAGAKYLTRIGKIREYRWAFHADEAIDALVAGPVVIGSSFPSGMRSPRNGVMRFRGSGMEDGHCYILVGYTRGGEITIVQNSWGRKWVNDGRAFLPAEELEALLRGDAAGADPGECCVPIE